MGQEARIVIALLLLLLLLLLQDCPTAKSCSFVFLSISNLHFMLIVVLRVFTCAEEECYVFIISVYIRLSVCLFFVWLSLYLSETTQNL